MSAEEFFTVALGRNPHQAFDRAKEEAYWDVGHGGYSGTIAEKPGFKMIGQVSTAHWKKVPEWFDRQLAVNYPNYRIKGRLPHKPIPPAYQHTIAKFVSVYDDKWGPAVGYEVTGTAAKKIRADLGRKGTMDKVYVFCGWASS